MIEKKVGVIPVITFVWEYITFPTNYTIYSSTKVPSKIHKIEIHQGSLNHAAERFFLVPAHSSLWNEFVFQSWERKSHSDVRYTCGVAVLPILIASLEILFFLINNLLNIFRKNSLTISEI